MAFPPKKDDSDKGGSKAPTSKDDGPVSAILLKLKGHGPDGDGGGPPPGPGGDAGGPPPPDDGSGGGDDGTAQAQQDLEHGATIFMQAVHQQNPVAMAQAFMAMFAVAQQVMPDEESEPDTGGGPPPGASGPPGAGEGEG